MASVHDVAAYVLNLTGPISAMKLQKLVYYSQAWSLVWDEAPLFEEPVQAWANGPVVRELYHQHRGQYTVGPSWPGDPGALSPQQRDTIEVVVDQYGKHTAQWLSELTHLETPWRAARDGLGPATRGDRVISLASMAEYYESLSGQGQAV